MVSLRFSFLVLVSVFWTCGELVKAQEHDAIVPRYDSSRALLIGVHNYDHWERLPRNSVESAISTIESALQNQGFDPIKRLPNPNLKQLRDEIQQFLALPDEPSDRLLLYYIGHGEEWTEPKRYGTEKNGYLVPRDAPILGQTPPASDRLYYDYLLNASQIVEWATISASKHILVVLVSCYSGNIHFRLRPNHEPPSAFVAQKADERVRVFLSAGPPEQRVPANAIVAITNEFTRAITGEAPQADLDNDQRVSAVEAWSYMIRPVNEQTGSELRLSTTKGSTRYIFFPRR